MNYIHVNVNIFFLHGKKKVSLRLQLRLRVVDKVDCVPSELEAPAGKVGGCVMLERMDG